MKLERTLLNRAVKLGTLTYDEARRLRDVFIYICDIWSSQVKNETPYYSHMKFYLPPANNPASFSADPPPPHENLIEILEITP